MKREGLLEIVKQLRKIITDNKLTPKEAQDVTEMFKKDISDSIEQETKDYMLNGTFK